jgi:hypothetical protein
VQLGDAMSWRSQAWRTKWRIHTTTLLAIADTIEGRRAQACVASLCLVKELALNGFITRRVSGGQLPGRVEVSWFSLIGWPTRAAHARLTGMSETAMVIAAAVVTDIDALVPVKYPAKLILLS